MSTPVAPATLTDVNLVAADMGGGVESLSAGNDEPGFTGWRLIDGLVDPTWKVPETWTWNSSFWVKYPFEAVFSFFERQSALVGGLTIVVPEVTAAKLLDSKSAAPNAVEVWTSMESPTAKFAKVAAATINPVPGEQTISFPAVEARFVKLRVLSGGSPKELEIAEVRVLEAARPGYTPLFVRAPTVKLWKGSPREAAQRGLDWLQPAALQWTNGNNCFGCHVQAQALMGEAVALKQGYRVNMEALRGLEALVRSKQSPQGTWAPSPNSPSIAAFGAMGLAHAAEATRKSSDPELLRALDNVLAKQEADGALGVDFLEPPIIQGQFMTTANALVALEWAATHTQDPKYKQAAERALAWIAAHEPETTQDRTFKIIALMHYGTPDQKRIAWSVVEDLVAQQQPDGGWKEVLATDGSNAFATGQALYAFKQAGVSVQSAMFRRGVDFLMQSQVNEPTPAKGSWKAMHTQSHRHSDFAPTMWAVIGLAGSYGTDRNGALQIAKQQGDKPATRNLEIVLDVSGSMNTKLGESTRWQTALEVLKEVVDTLPEDLTVGLRVYGHRYPSKSAQTCQDTELVVPLERLDRDRLLKTASQLRPRGETPLIRSVLKTVGDLRAAGGGSVILITDGEESCRGNARAAAGEIKASGVNVTLNIVGFTLTGKAVEAELTTLAGSTGGRYYGAQDGAQLAHALMLASLQRLPYDILDAAGQVIVSGQTSQLGRELPPGQYRIRVHALEQELEAPVTIVPDQITSLAVGIEGDHFAIRR